MACLLAHGAAPNGCTAQGDTPLHFAARSGFTEFAKLVIERGATIDIANKYGDTALHWAICYGHTDLVMLFTEKSAKSDQFRTP